MYTYEDEVLSPESIISCAMNAADLARDLDAEPEDDDIAGWARHAHGANGFGDDGLMPDN